MLRSAKLYYYFLLIFVFILAAIALSSSLHAQDLQGQNSGFQVSPTGTEVIQNWALLYIHFENRNRFSWGPHDQECSGDWPHNPPWGNWGVASNFGDVEDDNQFRGWYPLGGWRQWSGCTIQRTMSGCSADDCPSQSSPWYNVSSWYPSSGGQVLNAQIRFVVEGCVAVDQQCP